MMQWPWGSGEGACDRCRTNAPSRTRSKVVVTSPSTGGTSHSAGNAASMSQVPRNGVRSSMDMAGSLLAMCAAAGADAPTRLDSSLAATELLAAADHALLQRLPAELDRR